ncbi:MAG: biotin synthase [Limnohabitans sp.]
MSISDKPPTLDPAAARRWAARPLPASAWLHEEVGRRMQERLEVIRLQPQAWADWEPWRGGLQAHQALCRRYPQASLWRVMGQADELELLRAQTTPAWWRLSRWKRPPVGLGLPPQGGVQMVWANLLLHQAVDPQALIGQWHRALAADGFLMFSCFGPDTLRELRAVHAAMGWPAPAHEFTDMHDWGDMLVQAGFAEPVMDMERITLTFETPERMLRELRELGRNLHAGRFAGLRGRVWQHTWLQAVAEKGARDPAGRLKLTFEVIYGHALKPQARPKMLPESQIGLDDMRQMLARRREPGS